MEVVVQPLHQLDVVLVEALVEAEVKDLALLVVKEQEELVMLEVMIQLKVMMVHQTVGRQDLQVMQTQVHLGEAVELLKNHLNLLTCHPYLQLLEEVELVIQTLLQDVLLATQVAEVVVLVDIQTTLHLEVLVDQVEQVLQELLRLLQDLLLEVVAEAAVGALELLIVQVTLEVVDQVL